MGVILRADKNLSGKHELAALLVSEPKTGREKSRRTTKSLDDSRWTNKKNWIWREKQNKRTVPGGGSAAKISDRRSALAAQKMKTEDSGVEIQ
jgi:hypothetical protein